MPQPEPTVYIGIVHYRHLSDQQDFEARAIIHCETPMEFDAFVIDYLSGRGMAFLNSANVCTVGSWFSRFGYDGDIASFARRVGGQSLGTLAFSAARTKLSALSDTESDTARTQVERKEYLVIENIVNISPLDPQFGIFPKKAVPDALEEIIFGNVNSNELPTKGFPLTYAIIDAAKVINLVSIMDSAGVDYRPLFYGEESETLKNVAPYLVRLDKANDFARSLFTKSHMPDALWDSNAAIYLRSMASLDELMEGYKDLTKAYEQDGTFCYFRFWEGEFAYAFFGQIITFWEQVYKFFYPSGKTCSIIALSLENKAARVFKPVKINLEKPAEPYFVLDFRAKEIFKKITLNRFEKEVVRWLLELDAKRFRPFGDGRLYAIARHAIQEGNKLNFEFKEEYIYFIYVMSYCGGWFHRSEMFADIGDLFKDDIGAERLVRAKTLFPRLLEKQYGSIEKFLMEYMKFPRRVENFIIQAGEISNIRFRHIEAFALDSARRLGSQNDERLRNFMQLTYTQYPDKLGDDNSRSLYVLLSVMLGKHFMHDPFFPWVSEIIQKETSLGEGLVAVLQYAIRRSWKFTRLNGEGYA